MPNWCYNTATFKHSDTDQIKRLVEAHEAGKLLGTFVPCPQELLDGTSPAEESVAAANIEKHGAADWYHWCIENWGTKWDVGADDGHDPVDYSPGQTEVTIGFDSAWAPPLEWYNRMADEFGFEIEAYYLEEGMAFCGKWTNEDWDSEGYEFAGKDADWIKENIPEDIVDHWDLISMVEMYDEDED